VGSSPLERLGSCGRRGLEPVRSLRDPNQTAGLPFVAALRLSSGFRRRGPDDFGDTIAEAEKAIIERYAPAARTMFGGARPWASVASPADLQKQLGPKDVLLDYFVQTEGVYCAVIKRDFFDVFLQPVPATELGGAIMSAYLAFLQCEHRRTLGQELRLKVSDSVANLLYPDPGPVLEHLFQVLQGTSAGESVLQRSLYLHRSWKLAIVLRSHG
jgi:hypothetical protein